MCGVESDTGGLRQGYRLQGREEAPGSVVTANGSPEAADYDVKRNFCGGKGEALEIRQAW